LRVPSAFVRFRVKASLMTVETPCSAGSDLSRGGYSYRRASIGSRREARAAGKTPKTTPTKIETPSPAAMDHMGTWADGKFGISDAAA
jgi:hypothetical protein